MSAPLRATALLAAGVVIGLVGRWLLVGAAPRDPRADLLRKLGERQAVGLETIAAEAGAGESTAQEVAMAQFYRLQEFRRLGTEAEVFTWLVPVPEGHEGDPLAIARAGSVRIPRIAIDPRTRETWSREAARLGGYEDSVDARIFQAFADVRDFLRAHPWPEVSGLAGLRGSEWADPDVTERWVSLNRALVSRVDALLSGR